jgi:glycosyltransferase involved in cell wall biosynthesis
MVVHQDYYLDARVIRYAEALAEANIEVDVLALSGSTRSKAQLTRGIRVHAIPLKRAYKHRQSYLVEYAVAFVLFSLWLLPLYLRRRHDVIHIHNMPDFLIFTALIPRILGARLILDIHDPMPEVYISKFGSKRDSAAVRFMKAQERYATQTAHVVITANTGFRSMLIRRGVPAHKITVVNNVADPRIFDRSRYPKPTDRADERFVLLYPGTIAPRYGLDVAIRALPELSKQIPHLLLRVIGKHTDHVDELKQLATQLNVSAWVEFRPAIPLHQVPLEMLRAHIGIYSAHSDVHMAVATPSKVLEYAAMGLPVVASQLPVLTEMFSPQAICYFESGNVAQFQDRILELYQNPHRRSELVQAADREYVQKYTWEAERSRYLTVIDELTQGKYHHVRV